MPPLYGADRAGVLGQRAPANGFLSDDRAIDLYGLLRCPGHDALYMYVCLYVCMYVCMYVCVCVCVCVCAYV